MEAAKQQMQTILINCNDKRLDVTEAKAVKVFFCKMKETSNHQGMFKILVLTSVVILSLNVYFEHLQSKSCSLELPRSLSYAFRPPENCNFCENVSQVIRVQGINREEFAEKYAYTGTPVIVEDATKNWTALMKFDYWYFRDIYQNSKRKQKILDCQFLPYRTGFKDIFEALHMPKERVEMESGRDPWYFGWSNCNPETTEELRRHYGRPYFLPATSENNAVDWFFIGTSGLGAHMHIDNVRLPSWQAQLSGSKRWILAPPPECFFRCKQFDSIVKMGDIIVLDTNKWYHQTFVQPGKISLTIGAEYD